MATTTVIFSYPFFDTHHFSWIPASSIETDDHSSAMIETGLLEGNGLLDLDLHPSNSLSSQDKANELFASAIGPFCERFINPSSPSGSQSEAQKALNAWGSQGSNKLNHQPYIPSADRGEPMDFDADLDFDQLLDEEMEHRYNLDWRQNQQQPSDKKPHLADHDDDELEAFLLAEEEHTVSHPTAPEPSQISPRPPSPPDEFFLYSTASPAKLTSTPSIASPSVSDLLESNGLLGASSQPSSQHSAAASVKLHPSTHEPIPTSAHATSLRAIEALSTVDMDTEETGSVAGSSEARAGPTRLPSRLQPIGVPKYIPAGFVDATTMDGTRVRFERRKRMKGFKSPAIMTDVDASQLLELPIHQLLDAVEVLKALDVVEREEIERIQARQPPKNATVEGSKAASKMWVDKHRPAKFSELLGDERVHRDVLGWLKEWDECVFKRKDHRKERHREYIKAKFGLPDNHASDQGRQHMWKDPYGRPRERIMMISGPPGLGKTTLAHVIGAHAGYNVYELNASDARTAGAVEDVIKMALESGSLKDPRPTLVVIDEIDGATGGGGGASGESQGFVRALVRLVEQGKGAGPKAAGLAARGKKQRKGFKPLLRPIICICNDLYAPSLRPLRPMAKLIRINKPPTNLVVKRLREICEAESLSVEARGLSLLAELTNGDIRSCLNALEFAKTKNIALTEAAVKTASIGIKDTGGTVHKAWEMLFRRQNRKQAAASSMKGANAHAADADGSPWNSSRKASDQTLISDSREKQKDFALVDTPQENVSRIVQEVISCSEYDKLAQGCFEHYPTLRAADGGWKRYRQVHDWLHFGQSISARAWSHGNYELLGFMPWSFVCWHLLFAHVGNALPEYPKVDYENHLKRSAFTEIITQAVGILPANVRSQFNRHSVITELGPSLMRILTPDLRPINNQLSRAEDKQAFSSLVSIMTSLNIKFVPDKISEEEAALTGQSAGQLVYKLDPPLDVFTQFEGKRSKEVGPSRFAVRQLVAREMERLTLRKNAGVEAGEDHAGSTSKSATAIYRSKSASANAARDAVTSKQEKIAVDFFGRPIMQKSATVPAAFSAVPIPEGMGGKKGKVPEGRASSASDVTSTTSGGMQAVDDAASRPVATDDKAADGKIKVFYRYHEGFSNAVRRPVKISSLL
ncbi:related to CTF18 - Chromosome Transmission Fidelity factor [Melanopsichium pennsylvanicum]|uniref:Related to CTF18 - Chromosome Transmission Fidelity factor n=2 Tax=Melanopsichium pennsylvanicum TaxID=63383 RepID=A0AAJ4XK07_9BASI|nr:related to CTF18-Chromosome Transmission Fidelity factor [Melanopsichium pennsylvanicum 4]SNX83885.1 related to CTF18 - Chromosome Transmission Fidelity factor [Melanopsichium pennsylvanicum]